MSLTEREKKVLQLSNEGLSDYKIAREIDKDAPNVTRSRKRALAKLQKAREDLSWAQNLGIKT